MNMRYILVSAALVAGAAAAGLAAAGQPRASELPSAFERPATAKDVMPSAAQHGALGISSTRRIASFGAGIPRAVFVAKADNDRMICFWDVDMLRGDRGGGCSDDADMFKNRDLAASLMYDGGPGIESVSGARIVGLVTRRVARVEVLNSAGSATAVPISADRGFAFLVPSDELAAGIGPVAVIAYDRAGRELTRQQTGFSG